MSRMTVLNSLPDETPVILTMEVQEDYSDFFGVSQWDAMMAAGDTMFLSRCITVGFEINPQLKRAIRNLGKELGASMAALTPSEDHPVMEYIEVTTASYDHKRKYVIMKAKFETTAGALFDNDFADEGDEYYSEFEFDDNDSVWDVSVKTDLGWTALS